MRKSRAPSVLWKSATLLCLVFVLTFLACSGGEEDSPSISCVSTSFTPASSTVANGDVFLGELTNTCSSVDVVVLVNDLSGIYTVGFDLTYPASIVKYDSYTAGPLLLKGSPANSPIFIVSNPSPGVLQVTATRLGLDPSVAAVGNEILLTLRFSKVASGTGSIDFDDSSTSPVQEGVQDEFGSTRPASFQPDHGGIVMVPF